MRSCCSTPRTAVAGARSATSAQAPCRSTKRSSASATIHISWTCARPTVDLLQRIDAKQECRSLETTVFRAESGLVVRRLRWPTGDDLRRLVDFESHGIDARKIVELLTLLRADI